MEIKHENIEVIDRKEGITQRDIREEQELTRRVIESVLTPLELKFGYPERIKIRKDLERELSAANLKDIGGNRQTLVFAHVLNILTINGHNITILIGVQGQEPPTISFWNKIKNKFK